MSLTQCVEVKFVDIKSGSTFPLIFGWEIQEKRDFWVEKNMWNRKKEALVEGFACEYLLATRLVPKEVVVALACQYSV